MTDDRAGFHDLPMASRCRRRAMSVVLVGLTLLTGCQTTDKSPASEVSNTNNRYSLSMMSEVGLPQNVGSVENANLQIPAFSPDGESILYLRSNSEFLSPMTLLGSPSPQDTPDEGSLSVWLRPTSGAATGRQLSQHRWAHSPVWSDSGRTIAYVVNEPPVSFIVHVHLATGTERRVGRADAINCFPRFDGEDNALLFCSGPDARGPFRVYRQIVGEPESIALTPAGEDCMFPIATDSSGNLLCAQAVDKQLSWVRVDEGGITTLAPKWGMSYRPAILQTWAGIASPLAPDRCSWLYYSPAQDRVSVCHAADRRVVNHRQGGIAGCWLTNDTIAIATSEAVFLVDTTTGRSPVLCNGQWLPCRYVPTTGRLLLLRKQNARRFAIVEMAFTLR